MPPANQKSKIKNQKSLPLFCLAGILWFPLASTRADWSLTTADFNQQHQLTVNTWDAQGLSVTGPDGKLVRVPTRDVVSLLSDHPAAGNKPWRLALRNGDLLLGEPIDISGQSLEFKCEIGTIAVPLKSVQSLSSESAPASTPLPASSDKDVVKLTNKDSRDGIIAAIDADKIQIATSTDAANPTTADIPLSHVQQISFAGATPPRTVPSLAARLTFAAGSRLTVPLAANGFAWTITDISFADPAGQPHKIASDQLASVEVLGGRVVYLTELDPAQDQQTSYLGGSWPAQINKNVLGDPLTVNHETYPRGIGVHTRSLLAYDLDGAFDILQLRVGMDDSAAPHGEADVSIVLDGKTLWSKHLESGPSAVALSEPLNLPIQNGHHLEFHADPVANSGRLDVLGRVDFLNVALIRR